MHRNIVNSLIILSSFFASLRGIEFQCTFENRGWTSPIGSAYTCNYPQVTTNSNSITLESVDGDHENGKGNSDVTGLIVNYEATLQRIPTNIDAFFPNLEALAWQYGVLVSITAEDLRLFPKLIFLYLGANKIVSLDSDLFQYTPRINLIHLDSNLITNVGFDLLSSLSELTRVYFTGNPCINFQATTPQAIQELTQMLMTQCPPLACVVRCTMNGEVDELKKTIYDQSLEIDSLREESAKQIVLNEERFQELQKQIKEILVIP